MTKSSFLLLCALGPLAVREARAVPADSPDRATRTLLLVDDHEILYRSGTHRVFHPLARDPANPVIKAEYDWEGAIAWMSVYRNPATGKYQLWYQGFPGDLAKSRTRRSIVAYAESDDGLVFRKPKLGLFDFNGRWDNSIVLVANDGTHDRYGVSVLVDQRDPDPSRRYKMAYYDFSRADDGVERPGLSVAFSPDGIHWTKYPQAPLVRTYYGGRDKSLPFAGDKGREWSVPLTMSDALDVIRDPAGEKFVIYGKMWFDGPDGSMGWKHGMGRIESRDFIHWSQPRLVLTPDDDDPAYVEFHTSPVFHHEGCYFGLLQILHRAVGGGVIDIELATSRDGFEWRRPSRAAYLLPRGKAGSFDAGAMFPCAAPVVLPDQIRFYYGGYSKGATSGVDQGWKTGIGLATMPRDRFAGLRPDAVSDQPTLPHPLQNIGQVTLRPIQLEASTRLTLNADASGGTIRVELLDPLGYRVRGFSSNDAVPIHGDSLRHPVRWAVRSLADLPPGPYSIRIHLDNAEVFALSVTTAAKK